MPWAKGPANCKLVRLCYPREVLSDGRRHGGRSQRLQGWGEEVLPCSVVRKVSHMHLLHVAVAAICAV